ncbi:PREDICTED: transmembrane emp24 domain-containing protein 4-like [Ficedula albicollis]|uniref:transmembrane emp24 domain-containing protein 4-like n=1 Tax=Ficedula albicollis TaxID=59894 RepID=UPI0007AD84EE|nr:PREDICTED: transmembrane emp24 domain-containing protein 4-like [Ficedula albicollis]
MGPPAQLRPPVLVGSGGTPGSGENPGSAGTPGSSWIPGSAGTPGLWCHSSLARSPWRFLGCHSHQDGGSWGVTLAMSHAHGCPLLAQVVLSRQYGSEGRFTFTSHTPGEHQICLHSNSTRMALFAGGKLRVPLDIQVGEHTNNYPEIAAKDKLTELQLRARQLLDQVEQIQKEQNYQRYREERFRMTSESTNQRVLWWSIAQTIILILTGIWQMRHLKSFFEAKKLV